MNFAPKMTESAGATAASSEQGVWQWPGPFPLHHGGSLESALIGWRLEGAAGAPVVVALGGISAHRRVFDVGSPREGWWPELAGPGLALDSTRVRVLGIDYLGASGQSTGPRPASRFRVSRATIRPRRCAA